VPYPPNQFEPNGAPDGMFNGGTPGTQVTRGQYALDWIRALGGDVVLSNNNTTMTVVMPFQPDNTPTPLPAELQTLVTNSRESIIAAVQGKQYPPIVTLPAQCAFIDPLCL
jgi:hypothetical protein